MTENSDARHGGRFAMIGAIARHVGLSVLILVAAFWFSFPNYPNFWSLVVFGVLIWTITSSTKWAIRETRRRLRQH